MNSSYSTGAGNAGMGILHIGWKTFAVITTGAV